MKFIGHLDVMRCFQKAMRRADIPISFTEGFSPHMVMSFALPLGVGLTSSGEYMDIEVDAPVPSKDAVRRLNEAMPEGLQVLSFRQIEEGKAAKAMTLVAAADYTVFFKQAERWPKDWPERLREFEAKEHIIAAKKTKTSEKEEDIRPMIGRLEPREDGIFMTLSAGSAANLKPELVMEAFAAHCGITLPEPDLGLRINREDLYGKKTAHGAGSVPWAEDLISLQDMGREIES